MAEKRIEESRHYTQIWDKVVRLALEVVEEECDTEFSTMCALHLKPEAELKTSLEKEYRILRRELKESCYGNGADDGFLDGRKLASVFCKALVNVKAFQFNTADALKLLKKRENELSSEALNRWSVHNIFINYKLAYYVGLQLVYLTLLQQLLSSEETREYGKKLNAIGHLHQYPSANKTDSFDINVIIGIARTDIRAKDFDMFLFAMQLYQIEMYTVEKLKHSGNAKNEGNTV